MPSYEYIACLKFLIKFIVRNVKITFIIKFDSKKNIKMVKITQIMYAESILHVYSTYILFQ